MDNNTVTIFNEEFDSRVGRLLCLHGIFAKESE